MRSLLLVLLLGCSWAAEAQYSVGVPAVPSVRGIADLLRQTGQVGTIDLGEQVDPYGPTAWPIQPSFARAGTVKQIWETWDRVTTDFTVSGTKYLLIRASGDENRITTKILAAKLDPTSAAPLQQQLETVAAILVPAGTQVTVMVYLSGNMNGVPPVYRTPSPSTEAPLIRDTLAATLSQWAPEHPGQSWALMSTSQERSVDIALWRITTTDTLGATTPSELCKQLAAAVAAAPVPAIICPLQATTLELYRKYTTQKNATLSAMQDTKLIPSLMRWGADPTVITALRDLWGFESPDISTQILGTYDHLSETDSSLWDIGGMPPPAKGPAAYAGEINKFWKKLLSSSFIGPKNYAKRMFDEAGVTP